MKLFHLSANTEQNIKEFIPRIPEDRMLEEVGEIPRVCLAPTIEDCLGAVPWGGINLDSLGRTSLEEYITCSDSYDWENIYFKVYEFEIAEDDNSLLSPEEIWQKGYVDDAINHHEYWYLENIQPTNNYIAALSYWDEEVEDLLSYKDQQAIDNGEDYEDVWNGMITTIIKNIQYKILEENHSKW